MKPKERESIVILYFNITVLYTLPLFNVIYTICLSDKLIPKSKITNTI